MFNLHKCYAQTSHVCICLFCMFFLFMSEIAVDSEYKNFIVLCDRLFLLLIGLRKLDQSDGQSTHCKTVVTECHLLSSSLGKLTGF